jgi:hypothetical protein
VTAELLDRLFVVDSRVGRSCTRLEGLTGWDGTRRLALASDELHDNGSEPFGDLAVSFFIVSRTLDKVQASGGEGDESRDVSMKG